MPRRKSCAKRQDVDSDPVGDDERVSTDVECLGAALERFETGRDILSTLNFYGAASSPSMPAAA